MNVGGPVAPVRVALVGESNAGDVVGQGVHPDIHDMVGVAGNLDAPVERGSGNRQVSQSAFDEADDFVLARVGANEVRLTGVERQQLVLIRGQFEEIAFLLDPFDRRALRPASYVVVAQDGFVFGVIGFVAYGIPAGVAVQINIAIVGHPLPNRLAGAMMLFFRGADETVERDIQTLIHLLEPQGIACRDFQRRQLLKFGGLGHLQAVLVGTGEKEDILAVEPRKARQRIGRDRLIGVADMRQAVWVRDSGGDVVDVSANRGWRGLCGGTGLAGRGVSFRFPRFFWYAVLLGGRNLLLRFRFLGGLLD